MDESKHKESLSDKLNELLDAIDLLLLHPKDKLKLYRYYILSKLLWDFMAANISLTWINKNLDNAASRFLLHLLEILVCGALDTCLLFREKIGLDIILLFKTVSKWRHQGTARRHYQRGEHTI